MRVLYDLIFLSLHNQEEGCIYLTSPRLQLQEEMKNWVKQVKDVLDRLISNDDETHSSGLHCDELNTCQVFSDHLSL